MKDPKLGMLVRPFHLSSVPIDAWTKFVEPVYVLLHASSLFGVGLLIGCCFW